MARLERWERFGAFWWVTGRHGDAVSVSLSRCDGGEEVDQLTSTDPALLDWLAGRQSSADGPPGHRR